MIYDSGEIVTGYRHQFLVKLEWYMTLDFLYQSSFFQDGNPNFFLHLIFLNSLVQIPFIQLLEKSELSWTLETREGKRVGFLLAFHWKHPPHLSCSPKMEALRLLFKKLPCCYRHQETRLALLSASWWLSRKLANLRFCNPEPAKSRKVLFAQSGPNKSSSFSIEKRLKKHDFATSTFDQKNTFKKLTHLLPKRFGISGFFCVPLPYLGNQVKTTMKFMFSGSFTSFPSQHPLV